MHELDHFLVPTDVLDWRHPDILTFVGEVCCGQKSDVDKAIKLYYAVRDRWYYDPFKVNLTIEYLKVSAMLNRRHGYCVEKAMMMTACCRAVGIPARLGFAKVTNHLGTSKLEKILDTSELVFHGYSELYLNGAWVKCTPSFNRELCRYLGVRTLEFDGIHDSIFQEYESGNRFMEYTHDYGIFDDLPLDLFKSELRKHYPHLFSKNQIEEDGFYFIYD